MLKPDDVEKVRVYRTRSSFGETATWVECDQREWDGLLSSEREILVKRSGGIVFVKLVDERGD